MNVAASRGIRKGFRTVIQVAAGGALTALVTAIAGQLDPAVQGIVMGAWVALIAFAQNYAETAGKIPTLLPSPGLVVGADTVVATVDAAADTAGDITGDVVDTAGDVVGEVTGAVGDLLDGDERGGIPLALLILAGLVVVLVGGLAVCGDALFEDEDEPNDLGVELVSRDYGGGGNDRDDSGDGSGECEEASGYCSDDDLSPRFDDSPIIICLPDSRCDFGGREEEET